MKEHVLDFLTATYDARSLAEKCRDYKDNKQWSPEEIDVLRKRGQKAIVINRIKNKVQGLVGLLLSRRTDPKAYARTPKHEKASHAITDALRYAKDRNSFDEKKAEVADNFFTEGYGAVFVGVDAKGDPKVDVIPWDRFYYDPHSRRKDFNDARYRNDTRGFPANPQIWEAVIAVPKWQGDQLESIELYPITLGHGKSRTVRGRPMFADSELSKKIIEDLKEASEPFGTEIEFTDGIGVVRLSK